MGGDDRIVRFDQTGLVSFGEKHGLRGPAAFTLSPKTRPENLMAAGRDGLFRYED